MSSNNNTPEREEDGTPFLDALGRRPRVQIIDVFLDKSSGDDYNVTDIAEMADMSRSTVYNHIDVLQEHGIIEQTRTIGDMPLYRLDHNQQSVEHLKRLDGALTNYHADQ